MASIHETAEGPPRRGPDEQADNAQIRRDVPHADPSSEAQANPRAATQRGSEPDRLRPLSECDHRSYQPVGAWRKTPSRNFSEAPRFGRQEWARGRRITNPRIYKPTLPMSKVFTQSQLQAIADALGDTSEGLTGPEIGHLLISSKMFDSDPEMTKRHRLYNAFAHSQNKRQDRLAILAFIR